ncbi:hypothetical protein ABZ930_36935 [Streptomyces sp. NPDC046716]|uniref:hypothetical protein n=1 Tax=Streptomyces sp. NPDC046716 TaxID=3157093 RepID=UPI0034116B4E
MDAHVIGFTGTLALPWHLAMRLPDGHIALTRPLTTNLTAQLTPHLSQVEPSGSAVATAGEPYKTLATQLVVEVAAGTTRHAVVSMIRAC